MEIKKNNLNYKFINTLIIVVIIFLIYLMKDLWGGVFHKIISITTPFLFGFTIAYILYPLLKKLQSFKIPKTIAIIIICIIVLLFVGVIFWLFIPSILPVLFDQTSSLFSSIIKFIQDLSTKFDLNLIGLKSAVSDISSNVTNKLGETISNGAIDVINQSINILTKTLIAAISAIYFLIDMDNIRSGIKKYLFKRNKRTFGYVRELDKALYSYFNGLAIYIIIQIIEYTFVFYLIGHPNYLLLAILSGVTTIIPYFGNLITNAIAVITAAVISPKLLILTVIVSLVVPTIDGNFTSPKIFKKTNKVPALLTIFAVFAGGVIYGGWGIILSLPITIILITTFRFYRRDINNKFHRMRRNKTVI